MGREATEQRRRFSGVQRVWLLSGGLAGTALVMAAVAVPDGLAKAPPARPPWWAFAAAFYLVETFVVHLQFRREAHSFSLSEIPLILGLFFLDPIALVTARCLGSAVALVVHRRQSPLKVAFNTAHFALEACVATVIFRAVAGLGDPLQFAGWIGAFLAAMAADLVAALSVSAAISLSEGRSDLEALTELLAVGSLATFANTGVGLIAVTVAWWHPIAAWLLVLVAAGLFLAYRGYARVRQRQQSLELLYDSTRVGQRSVVAEDVVTALLSHGREMFRAELAEVLLIPREEGEPATRTTLDQDGSVRTTAVDVDTRDPVWSATLAGGKPALLTKPFDDDAVRSALARRGLRDAMVAPMFADSEVVGGMLIANRLGDVSTFDVDDLKLLEALANHASVSVDNAQLIERLRQQARDSEHMALHDSLTGLANRTLFHTTVREAVRTVGRGPGGAAVMIVDLDRFKEVNDTLGHHTGDLVLREASSRLTRALGERGTVARLGGDEFALVLTDVSGRGDALGVGEELRAALARPFQLDDVAVDIAASIGIALAPEHGDDADTLMQRADVAMYLAKEDRDGCAIYSPDRDRYTPARLALVGELRRAIERGELGVAFQPKTDARTGEALGFEALVRWVHASRGSIPPDEFVPLAENAGLIKPLTMLVLDRAIAECARWRSAGWDLTVAVNLSARLLRDADLPEAIAGIARRRKLPLSSLILEITESSIMAEPARAEAILSSLSSMGIGLSIDDFGTGYSSLSYLPRLPVNEIKMDRSFVMGMTSDAGDAVIVRSTIDLGHNLGLRVVAEGVESARVLEELEGLGCDVVQGYFVGRPMRPPLIVRWLEENRALRPAATENVTPIRHMTAG